jgi:hypothetical protein
MIKKTFIIFLMCVLMYGTVSALVSSGRGRAGNTLVIHTVATLPVSPADGSTYVVTDGADSSDCTVGLGTALNICIWDDGGASYVIAGAVSDIKFDSDCSGITTGICFDTDDGKIHTWDGDSVEIHGVLDWQPLEATLSDIADGTVNEDLDFSPNPLIDAEVANALTLDTMIMTKLTAEPGAKVGGQWYRADKSAWNPASLSAADDYYAVYNATDDAFVAILNDKGSILTAGIEMPTLEADEMDDSDGTPQATPFVVIENELKFKKISNSGAVGAWVYTMPEWNTSTPDTWNFEAVCEAAQDITLTIHADDKTGQYWHLNGYQLATDENIVNTECSTGENLRCYSTEDGVYCYSDFLDWKSSDGTNPTTPGGKGQGLILVDASTTMDTTYPGICGADILQKTGSASITVTLPAIGECNGVAGQNGGGVRSGKEFYFQMRASGGGDLIIDVTGALDEIILDGTLCGDGDTITCDVLGDAVRLVGYEASGADTFWNGISTGSGTCACN